MGRENDRLPTLADGPQDAIEELLAGSLVSMINPGDEGAEALIAR